MKLWMIRELGPYVVSLIHFNIKSEGDNEDVLCVTPTEFKSLTSLPLPRKGSKRQVDVKILIKDMPKAKGAK